MPPKKRLEQAPPRKRRGRKMLQPYLVNDRPGYIFPKNREMFQSVNDKFHVRDLLAEECKKCDIWGQMHTYHFERGPRSYIYTKCVPCNKQKLKYIRINNQNQKFKLIYFDNVHTHPMISRKSRSSYNLSEIYQQMKRTPKTMLIDEFKDHLKSKFQISDSNFYYLLSKFKRQNENVRSLIQHLRKQGCKIWTSIDDIVRQQPIQDTIVDDPDFFMFVFPKMVEYYMRYGECLYIHVIHGLIKKKYADDDKQWEIVAFNGITFNNNFAPFALAFVKTSSHVTEDIVQIATNLFELTKKTPNTIVTPSQQMFTDIIDSLRRRHAFTGLHLLDGINELDIIQKIITDANQFKFFQQLVHSTSRADFMINLQKLYKNTTPLLQTRKVINMLLTNAHRMCFALIQTDRFVGMGFKYSGNKYMSVLVRYLFTHNTDSPKSSIPRPKQLYPAIKVFSKEYTKLMAPDLPYIKYQTWQFEKKMDLPQMQYVRNKLKAIVLQIFLLQFNKVFRIDARERKLKDPSRPKMRIYDVFDKHAQALYVIAARPQYDSSMCFTKFMWRCSCLYSLKCGMPCCHQIKVVLMNGTSLLDQIHDRWIQVKIGRKKAPGRPKMSRRNTMG